jgi:hypothetical protein
MSDGPDESDPRGDALDSLRIRQLSALRRATYRSRSHAIIAAAVCVGAGIQIGWMTVQHLRAFGWQARPIVLVMLIALCMFGTVWFVRRAVELHRAARSSVHAIPTTTPDFSPLSDGGQQVRNLEQID